MRCVGFYLSAPTQNYPAISSLFMYANKLNRNESDMTMNDPQPQTARTGRKKVQKCPGKPNESNNTSRNYNEDRQPTHLFLLCLLLCVLRQDLQLLVGLLLTRRILHFLLQFPLLQELHLL